MGCGSRNIWPSWGKLRYVCDSSIQNRVIWSRCPLRSRILLQNVIFSCMFVYIFICWSDVERSQCNSEYYWRFFFQCLKPNWGTSVAWYLIRLMFKNQLFKLFTMFLAEFFDLSVMFVGLYQASDKTDRWRCSFMVWYWEERIRASFFFFAIHFPSTSSHFIDTGN